MTPDVLRRFMSKFAINEQTGCWIFASTYPTTGYGRFYVDPLLRQQLAHRVAYEHFVGAIPDGMVIDHLCRTRACANPDHLEVVTRGENNRRGNGWSGRNHAKTHCNRGHLLAVTAVVNDRGHRKCLPCIQITNRATNQRYLERKKAQA